MPNNNNLLVPTELVEKAVQGDKEAISEIYNECNKPVRRFVKKKLRKRSNEKESLPEDVEDAVSETFTRMVKNMPDLKNPQAFTKWIFVIADSVCKRSDEHTIKDDKYLVDLNMPASNEYDDKSDLNSPFENYPDETIEAPDDYTVNTELWKTVASLIENLPEKQKEVINQFYFEQRSLEEIADSTGENVSSVKSQKRYGIKKLQKGLKKFGYGGNFVVVPAVEFFCPMRNEVKIGGRGIGVTVSSQITGTVVPLAALFTISIVGLAVFNGLKDNGPNLRGDVRVNSGTDSHSVITTDSLTADTESDIINTTMRRTNGEILSDTDVSTDKAPAVATAVPAKTTAVLVDDYNAPDSPDVIPDYEPNTQPNNEPTPDSSLPDDEWKSVPYSSGTDTDYEGMTADKFYDEITNANYDFKYRFFYSDDLRPNYLEISDVAMNTLNNIRIEFTYNMKSFNPESFDLQLSPRLYDSDAPFDSIIKCNKKVIDGNKITYYFNISDNELLIENENGSSFLETYGYFFDFISPTDVEYDDNIDYDKFIYYIDDEGAYFYTAPYDVVEKSIEPFYQEDGILSLAKDVKSITVRYRDYNSYSQEISEFDVGVTAGYTTSQKYREFYDTLPDIFDAYNIKDVEIDKENPYFKKIGKRLYYHDVDANEDYFIIELSGV